MAFEMFVHAYKNHFQALDISLGLRAAFFSYFITDISECMLKGHTFLRLQKSW